MLFCFIFIHLNLLSNFTCDFYISMHSFVSSFFDHHYIWWDLFMFLLVIAFHYLYWCFIFYLTNILQLLSIQLLLGNGLFSIFCLLWIKLPCFWWTYRVISLEFILAMNLLMRIGLFPMSLWYLVLNSIAWILSQIRSHMSWYK